MYWLIEKVAVIVPVPPTVAVADAEFALSKVIDPVSDDQVEKKWPVFGVAVIEMTPAFSQILEPTGDVDPVPEGLSAKVTWYCSCLLKVMVCVDWTLLNV